jgi:hypothetical protein
MRPARLRVAEHLFHGRITIVDAAQAILPQSAHPLLDGFLADDNGRSNLVDQIPYLVVDRQELKNTASPGIAGVVTG